MRIFVAVDITEPMIRDNIKKLQAELAAAAQSNPASIRMVDAGILHYTLQFLGEVSSDAIQGIVDALSSVKFVPFDLKVARVGAFPNVKSPRIIWVGGTTQQATTNYNDTSTSGLAHLAQKVSDVLESLGHIRDKPFKAHSTISRVKNKNRDVDVADILRKESDLTFGIQKVQSFKLKESRLTPRGPVYTDLAEITSKVE